MIEGIDYYPQQKKFKLKYIVWIVLLISIIAFVFWYFSNKTNTDKPNKPQPILIKVTKTIINPKTAPPTVSRHKPQQSPPKYEVENLDEVTLINN